MKLAKRYGDLVQRDCFRVGRELTISRLFFEFCPYGVNHLPNRFSQLSSRSFVDDVREHRV